MPGLSFQKSARAGHVEPPEVAALSDIGSWVMSAEEFRKYAEEHQGWARTARSDRERAIFTQMANAWLEVAATNESAARQAERMRIAVRVLCQRRAQEEV